MSIERRNLIPSGVALAVAIGLSFVEPTTDRFITAESSPAVRSQGGELLGGFRSVAADLKWIAVYHSWSKRDETALHRELNWVIELNPNVLLFWLNGARMLGFDVAAWKRGANPDIRAHPSINRVQLERALQFLDQASKFHPDHSAIPIEEAILHLRLTDDIEAAEQAFARAQSCADAPFYVARVRAQLLERLGQPEKALRILEIELERLPEDDPRAMLSVVRARIARLRQKEPFIL